MPDPGLDAVSRAAGLGAALGPGGRRLRAVRSPGRAPGAGAAEGAAGAALGPDPAAAVGLPDQRLRPASGCSGSRSSASRTSSSSGRSSSSRRASGGAWCGGCCRSCPVPYADDVAWMAAPMEVFAVLALLSLAGGRGPPLRLHAGRPGADAGRDDGSDPHHPVAGDLPRGPGCQGPVRRTGRRVEPGGGGGGSGVSGLGIGPEGASGLYLSMWWAHMATVLGFLAYLPYSKHAHLLVRAVRRVLHVVPAGRDAGGVGGGLEARGLHLAAALQRADLRGVRALRAGVSGPRQRVPALAQGRWSTS